MEGKYKHCEWKVHEDAIAKETYERPLRERHRFDQVWLRVMLSREYISKYFT